MEDASTIRFVARSVGVPDGAVFIEAVGDYASAANVRDAGIRPTRGGIQITGTTSTCTLGFNVYSGSTKYILTASHCENAYLSGPNYETFYQHGAGKRVGYVSVNPAWRTTGCSGSASRCDTADVALVLHDVDTVSRASQVAQTVNVGTTAASTDLTIATYYNVALPNTGIVQGDSAYKTGRSTGSTKGTVNGTCVMIAYTSAPPVVVNRSMACQVEVDAYGEGGDSGGPVYRFRYPLQNNAREPLGILHSVSTQSPWRYAYSPWDAIEARLGLTLWPD